MGTLGAGRDSWEEPVWSGSGDIILRKGMWGETTRIEEHLRGGMERVLQEIPKYIMAALMRAPSSVVNGVLTGHILSLSETSSPGIGLQLLELLAKEVLWEPLNNSGYCQNYISFSLQLLS